LLRDQLLLEFLVILKGMILGISIAAPVGPIGILCIRRTIEEDRLSGLISGLGAACADAIFATIAVFGITQISNLFFGGQILLRISGIIYLLFLGVKTFFSVPVIPQQIHINPKRKFFNFLSTFLLTLTNPVTIISFAAIFTGIGVMNPGGNYFSQLFLVMGVFLGSVSWWFFLSSIVGGFRLSINLDKMRWINKASGVILISFGALAIFNWIN